MNITRITFRVPNVQLRLVRYFLLAGFAASLIAQPAAAGGQSGAFEISVGATQLSTHVSSTELGITSPVIQPFPGSGFTTSGFATLGLGLRYWATDSSTLELWGGIPRTSSFNGTGTINSASINPLGTSRALSPTFLYRFHFNEPSSLWRPSIAAGVNYTRFTNSELNPQFQAFLSNALTLGGSATNPSSVEFSSSWNPAISFGLDHQLTADWKISSSLTYMPLKSKATIKTIAGSTVFISNGELTINPALWFIGVSRKF